MNPELWWSNLETINSYLPEWLNWIKNEKEFIGVYESIKSYYGSQFSDNELKLIKDSRNSSCSEYKWNFDQNRKIAVARNRIDSILFRLHYTHFFDLDKKYIMWTLRNANTQRRFRQIIIDLENKYGELYNSEISEVITTLEKEIKKTPASDSQIFETIYNNLSEFISNNRKESITVNNWWWQEALQSWNQEWVNSIYENNNIYSNMNEQTLWNLWNSVPWHIPQKEIESMAAIAITKDFSEMKELIIGNISFEWLHYYDENWNKKNLDETKINYIKKYADWVFNDFAKQIDTLFEWNTPKEIFTDLETLSITSEYFHDIIIGKETSSKNLVQKIEEKLTENDNVLKIILSSIEKDEKKLNNKIDRESVEKIEITEKELKDIKINSTKKGINDILIHQYKVYKYLKQIKEDWWKLDPELEELFKKLEKTFNNVKKRVLKEISLENKWSSFSKEYSPLTRKFSAESTNGNIKDIKPIAIVETNKDIINYVYWDEDKQKQFDIDSTQLAPDERINLLKKIKKQNKDNPDFRYNIRFLNKDWSINYKRVSREKVDIKSVKKFQENIEDMIRELAIQERLEKLNKKEINEINTRRSAMVCCFRAISKFFDTVNNNWENFADEFEVKSENIKFKDWIISMEWTIWANKNHIKLYYNTNTWELEFDNFLAYDNETCSYKIWQWNWKKEKINITLPTMEEMQQQANSVNLNLINKLPLNIYQYERLSWFAMSESIWLNCFHWFMWADMEVNKSFIEQFNEKNKLQQDIINNIYSKFYDQNGMKNFEWCVSINEQDEPEQFKLIKLISDTIDNCWSSSELLRFRNTMNELDEILTNNHELVKEDTLLKYLFADNLSDNSDITDTSKAIIGTENEDWATSGNENNHIATYESQQKYENKWNKTLNYYMFLGILLSEDKWDKKIINLDSFEDAINTIKTNWKHLLDNKQWLLWENYRQNISWDSPDFPDFSEVEKVQKATKQKLVRLEEDVKLEDEYGSQIEQAYT